MYITHTNSCAHQISQSFFPKHFPPRIQLTVSNSYYLIFFLKLSTFFTSFICPSKISFWNNFIGFLEKSKRYWLHTICKGNKLQLSYLKIIILQTFSSHHNVNATFIICFSMMYPSVSQSHLDQTLFAVCSKAYDVM